MDYQNRMLNELTEPARKEILEKANAILAKARKDKVPVIYVEVRKEKEHRKWKSTRV